MPDMRPLAERLRPANGQQLTALLAQQAMKAYFSAFSTLLRDQRFDAVYQYQMRPFIQDGEALVCQFLYQLPKTPERDSLLYQILAEPFASMQVKDYEETEEDDDTECD